MTHGIARAPNGKLIVGTLERLVGRANTVVGSFERDENGKLTFEYEGYTEVFWEEQRTVHKHGALCKRLTNTPVLQAGSVLKCPDDRKNGVVSAQATYTSGGSAVGV